MHRQLGRGQLRQILLPNSSVAAHIPHEWSTYPQPLLTQLWDVVKDEIALVILTTASAMFASAAAAAHTHLQHLHHLVQVDVLCERLHVHLLLLCVIP